MRTRRRESETAGLSFLDCICCGFGAVLLLLVITKIHQPSAIEALQLDLAQRAAELERELAGIDAETAQVSGELEQAEDELTQEQAAAAELERRLASLRRQLAASEDDVAISDRIEQQLERARQELSEEMQRLGVRASRGLVGGIPVDSEYIVFIIDTSGSMRRFNWDLVVEKVYETLKVYPRVKGIQVINDMGTYMFSGYAGKWIPDSDARRRAIMSRLRQWEAFSNSSPVEGITAAIRAFWAPDRRISLYVFGDEFTGDSIQRVVDKVARINRSDSSGRRRVRIHGIGFPIPLGHPQATSERFAVLMRELCQRNGGTFVALTNPRGS